MEHVHRILVAGGSGRNVGKTEFICRLTSRTRAYCDEIYLLKASAIFPDEALYHGTHDDQEGTFFLAEETRRDTRKDTSRMLRAGATRAFYLRCEDTSVLKGLHQFLKKIPADAPIICESNSLARFIAPGLSVMVVSHEGTIKPRALQMIDRADLIITSDGESGFPGIERIRYTREQGWFTEEEK